jgi:hypothetical protein
MQTDINKFKNKNWNEKSGADWEIKVANVCIGL